MESRSPPGRSATTAHSNHRLAVHITASHPTKKGRDISWAGKTGSYSSGSSLRTTKEPKRTQCEMCGITAADQNKLRRHVLRVHEKIRRFPCRACDKHFCVKHERDRHEYAKHENVGSFRCSKCSKTFNRKYLFAEHLQNVHKEELDKPVCPDCGATFENNALLIGHRRSNH